MRYIPRATDSAHSSATDSQGGTGGTGAVSDSPSKPTGTSNSATISTSSSSSSSSFSSSSPSLSSSSSSSSSSTLTTTSSTSSSPSTTSSSLSPTSVTENTTVFATTSASSSSDATSSSNTVSFTTLMTDIDGSSTTFVSPLPTSLSTDNDSRNTNFNRTALIAGATAAGVVLIALALGAVFIYRRAQTRRISFIQALIRGRREGKAAGSIGLLDGEFDEDEDALNMRYRDTPTPHKAPSLFPARANDSGSLFREAVWPPPREEQFVDPFVGNLKIARDTDLSRIVDDVMGPPLAAATTSSVGHGRGDSSISDNSATAAQPAGEQRDLGASFGSLYNDPFRDASRSTTAVPSLYYYNAKGGEQIPNVPLESSSSASLASAATTASNTSSPRSLLGLPSATASAKKPSPLANSVVATSAPPRSPSAAQAIGLSASSAVKPNAPAPAWIQRSPKKHTKQMSTDSSKSDVKKA